MEDVLETVNLLDLEGILNDQNINLQLREKKKQIQIEKRNLLLEYYEKMKKKKIQ